MLEIGPELNCTLRLVKPEIAFGGWEIICMYVYINTPLYLSSCPISFVSSAPLHYSECGWDRLCMSILACKSASLTHSDEVLESFPVLLGVCYAMGLSPPCMSGCGGLILADSCVPTKPCSHSVTPPPPTGEGDKMQ